MAQKTDARSFILPFTLLFLLGCEPKQREYDDPPQQGDGGASGGVPSMNGGANGNPSGSVGGAAGNPAVCSGDGCEQPCGADCPGATPPFCGDSQVDDVTIDGIRYREECDDGDDGPLDPNAGDGTYNGDGYGGCTEFCTWAPSGRAHLKSQEILRLGR